MSGRRSHIRFSVVQSPEGTFRVMRDVLVQRASEGEIIAVSREAGVVGEPVAVDFPAGDAAGVRADVIESQPVVMNGSVRHRLRLRETGVASSRDGGIRLRRGQVDE